MRNYEMEAMAFKTEVDREATVTVNLQKQAEAESKHDLALKEAEFDQRVNIARERSQAAAHIEKAKQA